ncbi:hypothetical protein C8Q80DRAFT_303183 [Daedaleopsis nitida]|nr:hypothetical protein C8Q80DRAFT_303183 [Daedaleopsis nitida]
MPPSTVSSPPTPTSTPSLITPSPTPSPSMSIYTPSWTTSSTSISPLQSSVEVHVSKAKGSNKVGAILGGVLGGLLLMSLVCILIICRGRIRNVGRKAGSSRRPAVSRDRDEMSTITDIGPSALSTWKPEMFAVPSRPPTKLDFVPEKSHRESTLSDTAYTDSSSQVESSAERYTSIGSINPLLAQPDFSYLNDHAERQTQRQEDALYAAAPLAEHNFRSPRSRPSWQTST